MPIPRPIILLLENDQADVFMFRRAVGRLGFGGTVRIVSGVTDAIRYLENTGPYTDKRYNPAPNLIVCDMGLFGGRGTELLDWLRKSGEFSDIPVVMLSGSALPSEKTRSMELGAKAFIVKSGDIGESTERLRELLNYLPAEPAKAKPAAAAPATSPSAPGGSPPPPELQSGQAA